MRLACCSDHVQGGGPESDDGEHFTYKYDSWGRLVEVRGKGSGTPLVAKYRYNGLGYRIGWLSDFDQSGTTAETGTGHDNWLWFIFNDRWQQVASLRVLATAADAWAYDSGGDTAPKEVFVHHAAGIDGLGGSSYIDDVILREADELDGSGNPAWAAAVGGAGAREDRLFYLQNWRADVVVTVRPAVDSSSDPLLVDQVRYSPYGVPWAVSYADVASVGGTTFGPDGQITSDDWIQFANWSSGGDFNADIVGVGGPPYPPDGSVDSNDVIAFYNAYAEDGGVTGRGVLSRTHSRRGYAGYEFDPGLELASRGVTFNGGATLVPSRSMWHVRNRVLDSEAGRWTRRDPLGYVDGMGLYGYVRGRCMTRQDGSGTCSTGGCGPLVVARVAPEERPTEVCDDLVKHLRDGKRVLIEYPSRPTWVPVRIPGSPNYLGPIVLPVGGPGMPCPPDSVKADPEYQIALDEMRKACGCEPLFVCDSMIIRPRSAFTLPGIGCPIIFLRPDTPPETYRHELRHAWQLCTWGIPSFEHPCTDLMRMEYDAYLYAGSCKTSDECCYKACDSVLTFSQGLCFHGDWAQCVTTCKQHGGVK